MREGHLNERGIWKPAFYVHLLAPTFNVTILSATERADGEVDYQVQVDFKHNYEIVPLQPGRSIEIDYRDEFTKHKSPDYQPVS